MARAKKNTGAVEMVTVFMTQPGRAGDVLRVGASKETPEGAAFPGIDQPTAPTGLIDTSRNGRPWTAQIPEVVNITQGGIHRERHVTEKIVSSHTFTIGKPEPVANVPEDVMDWVRTLGRQRQIILEFATAPGEPEVDYTAGIEDEMPEAEG